MTASPNSPPSLAPWKGSPGAGLFAATLGFFVGFASVALFGPTAARFQEVLGISPTLVGLLVATPALTGSLLRIPFAAWVDTAGGRRPFLVLLSLSAAGMAGLTAVVWLLYPDRLGPGLYPLLLLLAALSGCGIAVFSVGVAQVSYWFPQRQQGRALGTYAGIGNLAPGIFSLLIPVVLPLLGLGGAYLAWLVFLLLGTALYALLGRNALFFQMIQAGRSREQARQEAALLGQQLFPAGKTVDSLKISARVWRTWALTGVYFATFGGFIGLTAWLPTFWTSLYKVTPTQAGVLTASYAVLASLCRVAGGPLGDRLGGVRTLTGGLVVMGLGAVVLLAGGSFAASLAGELLLALGMGVGNAAVFKLVPQAVPQAVGGAAGWVGGLGAFGGFVVPPLLGAFVVVFGVGGYTLGFSVFLVLALLGLGLTWLVGRREVPLAASPIAEQPGA